MPEEVSDHNRRPQGDQDVVDPHRRERLPMREVPEDPHRCEHCEGPPAPAHGRAPAVPHEPHQDEPDGDGDRVADEGVEEVQGYPVHGIPPVDHPAEDPKAVGHGEQAEEEDGPPAGPENKGEEAEGVEEGGDKRKCE